MKATLPLLAAALLLATPCAAQTSDSALAQRVQQLEDERAIREVLVQYGEFLDARDYAAYSRLFARDGVWTGGFGSFTGPAAIEKMLVENLGAPEPGFVNKNSFHLMTTMVVHVHGDTATVRSRYMFFTATEENRPSPVLAGRYEDEFVREDGAWKIRRRITHGVIPWRDGNDPTPAAPPPGVPTRR